MDGQLDIFGALAEQESQHRLKRGGLMLDVLDPEQIKQYRADWHSWPERSRFYGFAHRPWDSVLESNGHKWAVFQSDTRCVCPIGYKNGPRIHDCSCVGGMYHRAYCFTCQWWSEVQQLSAEAKALGEQHAAKPEKPAQPPFKVSINVWQDTRCGWCGKSSTIGGFATRHRDHEDISIYGEYCTKCSDKYGDPRLGSIELVINLDPTPGKHGGHEKDIADAIRAWEAL